MPKPSSNPLFHKKTLKNSVQQYDFPEDFQARHNIVQNWIDKLESGILDSVKETSLHGDFLRDIFQDVLGYQSVIQSENQNWSIHAEKTISDGGGSADGALGLFTATEGRKGKKKLIGRVIAPIELKGTKSDIDRPDPGRKESAVDQGWRYANYTQNCKWVIVSNYREIRLYQTSKTPVYFEKFTLKDLENIDNFQEFYFLLCSENFLPKSHKNDSLSRIDNLLQISNNAELEITKELYKEYKSIRVGLVQHLQKNGPKDIDNRDALFIEKSQKLLDRVLFIAFSEDRGLLPRKTIAQAHDHKDKYNPRPVWDNYKAIFRWVDKGNDDPPIPGYNGGLFKNDPLLDEKIQVSDDLCSKLKELARFDFDTDISVDILGRIFEQSVTDLEELRALAKGEGYNKKKGKRKTQGVYYTPEFITQYIVSVALGGYLEKREQELRDLFQLEQIPKNAPKKRRDAEKKFWEAYRDKVLTKTRIIDPACGSGAFLIAAFDFLSRQYERVNEALAALELASKQRGRGADKYIGQRSLFDLTTTILNQNLYGVDLSPESVEITKLSLWLKTAERGKTLTYLDNNIKVGNSIISDPAVDPYAFDWEIEFPEVFASGGFDLVIGNPPYVRQELLTPFKPYLQENYTAYDGMADIYVYFYEKGLNILKANGILSYIVTNKWLRAGYGEPLRKFFGENSVFEQIINFGHAPIFEDADVFPCIVSVRKPESEGAEESDKPEASAPVKVCSVSKEHLENINLPQYINQEGHSISWSRFSTDAWSLEPPAVDKLLEKIKDNGIKIGNFLGSKPLFGLKTGLNDAYLIDEETRRRIINADSRATEIIKPFLKGKNISRWHPEWDRLWIILLKSSNDHEWPWSILDESEAEENFRQEYPSVYTYMSQFEAKLRKRQDQGKFWWELRSCAYYELFEKPKVITQDLATYSWFCFDKGDYYTVNTCYILPTNDLYFLGWLCSPITWWYCHRFLQHSINDTLRMFGEQVVDLPVAPPTEEIRAEVESNVQHLIEFTKTNQAATRDILDWLQLEHGIEKLGNKLRDFANLSLDEFLKEIKKRRSKNAGSFGPKTLKELKEAYNDYALPIQNRRTEGLTLEYRISDLVNQAYGLNPNEIDLMWKTAPPRMPFTPKAHQ